MISFTIRKMLVQRLQQAYADHAPHTLRRIHALPGLADGITIAAVAEMLGVGEQTVRAWLHAFVRSGAASLAYRCSPGHPMKLTRSQRNDLRQCVLAGPEAAGYPTACWT